MKTQSEELICRRGNLGVKMIRSE
jgi:hypothetical protein